MFSLTRVERSAATPLSLSGFTTRPVIVIATNQPLLSDWPYYSYRECSGFGGWGGWGWRVGGLAGSGGTAGTLISHLWIAACGPVGRLRSIDRIRKIVPALTGHE